MPDFTRKISWILVRFVLTTGLWASFTLVIQGQAPSKVLEIWADSTGMVSESGKHLYIRVSSTGKVEYEQKSLTNGVVEYRTKEKNLSESGTKDLQSLLLVLAMKDIQTEYKAINKPLDHSIKISIEIQTEPFSKNISIVNFAPEADQDRSYYPSILVDLLCMTEKILPDDAIRVVQLSECPEPGVD